MDNKVFADNIQRVEKALDVLTEVLYGEAGLPCDEECSSEDGEKPERLEDFGEEGNCVDVMDFDGNLELLDAESCRFEDVAEVVDGIVYDLEVRRDALQRGALDDLDADGLRDLVVAVCEQHFCLARCYQDTLDELLHALFVAKASLCGAAVYSTVHKLEDLMGRLDDFVGDDSAGGL